MLDKNKVIVGLSGGVDSSTVAYILKNKGYDVIGATLHLFDEYDNKGNIIRPSFIDDAKRVAKALGISHHIVDYRSSFNDTVKREFVEKYLDGKTPNPCVTCNKLIKYGKFLEYAHSIGAYYLATGHYAKILYDGDINKYRLFKGESEKKDQAYLLHSLTQEQLKHILLPLGEFKSKEDVRKVAKGININISKKKDSLGICFIPNEDYTSYLSKQSPDGVKGGDFVDLNGNIIGRHKGIVNYTIGQRRGLGVKFDKPKFVISINPKRNQVVLGDDRDTYSKGLIAINCNFTLYDKVTTKLKVKVKVCQWGWFLPAIIYPYKDKKVKVVFDKKERAIAPGQAVVFYDKDEVIGGGTIEKVLK
ncbi:tRNA 2-thiouridine(34) synthase MnmA [Dethiothermospora halolimnae]|uniref:tRNA 2-thiouridine(34) synthase MnmA n=1 Tax=Dethiothermospora halolimnae TaxID=3114390 RepID=UPI003CCB7424